MSKIKWILKNIFYKKENLDSIRDRAWNICCVGHIRYVRVGKYDCDSWFEFIRGKYRADCFGFQVEDKKYKHYPIVKLADMLFEHTERIRE